MISETVVAVLLGVFVMLQCEYIWGISDYLRLDYLQETVIATFVVVFLAGLYFVYKVLSIQH